MNIVASNNLYTRQAKQQGAIVVLTGIIASALLVYYLPALNGLPMGAILLFLTYMHYWFVSRLVYVQLHQEHINLVNIDKQVPWQEVTVLHRFWMSPIPAYRLKIKDSSRTCFFYSDWGLSRDSKGQFRFQWANQMKPFIKEIKKAHSI